MFSVVMDPPGMNSAIGSVATAYCSPRNCAHARDATSASHLERGRCGVLVRGNMRGSAGCAGAVHGRALRGERMRAGRAAGRERADGDGRRAGLLSPGRPEAHLLRQLDWQFEAGSLWTRLAVPRHRWVHVALALVNPVIERVCTARDGRSVTSARDGGRRGRGRARGRGMRAWARAWAWARARARARNAHRLRDSVCTQRPEAR